MFLFSSNGFLSLARRFQHSFKIRRRFSYNKVIDIRPDIKYALENKEPVVALESTIITHGMPFPHNLNTATAVEEVVRMEGALPATIAILDGKIKVGLQRHEMKKLAQMSRDKVMKCSRRDLPYIVAHKKSGGTTVAATMIIADKCGIKVFATGGIGGVHREGHLTMDISADLIELGRTPVAVVSSGVKSILDIPRTLEFLETQGVCVTTYGDAEGKFPDFYTRDSGLKVAYNCISPKEVADLILASNDLNLRSGILIAVPIPQEYEADKHVIAAAIDQAYQKAYKSNISGKDVTPFVLEAVSEATKCASLKANIALIKNNASVAAKVAVELCALRSNQDRKLCRLKVPTIIGGSILDLSMTLQKDDALHLNGATYKVNARQSAGGVARNLAEGIFKIHGNANLITAIGADQIGSNLLNFLPDKLKTYVHIDEEKSTSICTLMFDQMGDCKLILGNMDIHEAITPQLLEQHEDILSSSPLIVFDSNLTLEAMEKVLTIAVDNQIPVFFEPTDMLIAHKPFILPRQMTKQIKFISPNMYELKTMVEMMTKEKIAWQLDPNSEDTQDILTKAKSLVNSIASEFDCILLTMGHHGVLLSLHEKHINGFFDPETGYYLQREEEDDGKRLLIFYPAPEVENIINVSGAGDSFNSGFLSELLEGAKVDQCIAMGFVAARKALQCNSAVPKSYFKDKEERSKLLNVTIESLVPVEL